MLSSHTVGFKRPDNSNLANLTPGLCILVGLALVHPLVTGRGRIIHRDESMNVHGLSYQGILNQLQTYNFRRACL